MPLPLVDDIAAILVIAIFYTESVSLVSLGVGALLLACAVLLNRLHVRSSVAYFILGTAVWVAFLKSGVHATIAALLMAFTIPTATRIDGNALLKRVEHYIDELKRAGIPQSTRMNSPGQQHALDQMVVPIEQASSPLLRLEHSLVPLVSFLVLPLFALANAGVRLDGGSYASLADPVAVGVIVGLFLGKQLGITLFAWIAVRFGIADLPREVSWRGIHGVGCLAGIGFTMSLFISGLALEGGLGETAKVGILVGSLILGVTGWLVLRGVLRAPAKNVAGSATPTSS
jgi:NhaA family Na+:H+ antiporter